MSRIKLGDKRFKLKKKINLGGFTDKEKENIIEKINNPFPCDKTDCRDYPEYDIMETTSRGRFFPYIVAICSYCEHMNKKDLYKKKNG